MDKLPESVTAALCVLEFVVTKWLDDVWSSDAIDPETIDHAGLRAFVYADIAVREE